MKRVFSRIALATLVGVAFGSISVLGRQQTSDPVKYKIYKRFVDNYASKPAVAYQAAKEYLQKYGKEKDQYTDYLKKWVVLYERHELKQKLTRLIDEKKLAEAFKVGAAILADEPDDLRVQIDLAYAGMLASSTEDESHDADALAYARKAIQALEGGREPDDWWPFKNKDDTLANLHYVKGFLTMTDNPEESIDAFIKAVQYESDIRTMPSTYSFLAVAYESGPYKTQSTAYKNNRLPEGPQTKAALEKLNVVVDRIIDAYARAIAIAITRPNTEQIRKEWLYKMTEYYKYRHGGSDAGITEFIAASIQKPLPAKP